MSAGQPEDRDDVIRRIHERPKRYLRGWLELPAHIHHFAYRMSDPPTQRPQSREEFQRLLAHFRISEENSVVYDKFGYGVINAPSGDRLIFVWEAHTEYYSHQVWHIPGDKTSDLDFGPLTFPGYQFPFVPLGLRVNALDIIISSDIPFPDPERLATKLPGRHVYASRVFGSGITIATSFTPDDEARERYLIFSSSSEVLTQHLSHVIDTVSYIENYYHLVLFPFSEFSQAVDQIHDFEQRHMKQRELITSQLGNASSELLLSWVTVLTEDFMRVSRLSGNMRYKLSAVAPYDAIVRANLHSLEERPVPPYRPLSDYVLGGISGVASGYHQFLGRIAALQSDFEGSIAVIRTRVDLALQDQNNRLLASMDKTTKSQTILQRTVEGLSIIVISYYLSGLAGYIFDAMHTLGWIRRPEYASAVFVPVALGISASLIILGRRFIYKR